jgi:hypothetical protein
MWRQDVNPFGGHCFREGNPSAGELAARSYFVYRILASVPVLQPMVVPGRRTIL